MPEEDKGKDNHFDRYGVGVLTGWRLLLCPHLSTRLGLGLVYYLNSQEERYGENTYDPKMMGRLAINLGYVF